MKRKNVLGREQVRIELSNSIIGRREQKENYKDEGKECIRKKIREKKTSIIQSEEE